jgi:prepilin-type N-terminal cleavage/methylation domain-containing protein
VGLALIELLVAVVIIALLAAAFYGLWRHGKAGQKSIPEQAKEKAQGVDCQLRLQQVRASIEMAKADNDDRPPASIPPDMAPYAFCPQTNQPYSYDPQTGRVWCTTPGHEKY